MEKVLNIVSKFDTFEGAAEAAGKLNAALGTNAVNAMDLLMETDPAALASNKFVVQLLTLDCLLIQCLIIRSNFIPNALGLI